MKATFIDFEDSFSYNVIQELELVGLKSEIVNWKDYEKNPESGLLVLGPGPGHPDDYQRIYPLIQEWLNKKKPLLGICLGHQIFWRIQGEEVLRSKLPLHGQKVSLELTQDWKEWLGIKSKVFVQRYNSLAVLEKLTGHYPELKNYSQDGEILITRSSHVITYQFHPESIGTTFRKQFMEAVYSII